jgi:signal peptidase II
MEAVPPRRYVLFFSIAVAGCLIDLATKSYMFDRLGMPGEQPIWWVWESVLGFETSLNEGALFGMFQGMSWLFSVASMAASVGILLWLFYWRAARSLLLTIALGCITAGIQGNLYDRLGLPGLQWNYANELHDVGDPVYAVRDWVKMLQIGDWSWPNFNIADSLLVCGSGLLIWHVYRTEPDDEESNAEDPGE